MLVIISHIYAKKVKTEVETDKKYNLRKKMYLFHTTFSKTIRKQY